MGGQIPPQVTVSQPCIPPCIPVVLDHNSSEGSGDTGPDEVEPSLSAVTRHGTARRLNNKPAKDDIHAFIFGWEGLMADLVIQGSRIARIQPKS